MPTQKKEPKVFAVGDVRMKEKGSGARALGEGKRDWSLFPLTLMEEVVEVWEKGADKYAPWNWAKGMAWSIPYQCAMRHLIAWWWKGERNDPETNCSHLAHVVCNIMMLMHYENYFKEGDDRTHHFVPENAREPFVFCRGSTPPNIKIWDE